MKVNFFSLLAILSVVFLFSCNQTDDDIIIPEEETVIGTWNLKNVSGGLIGINIDYTEGEVSWKFQSDNTLIIEKNIITTGPEDIYSGLASGTYSYEIQQNGDNETLFIESEERGIINLSEILTIDDGLVADGFITTFEKQ